MEKTHLIFLVLLILCMNLVQLLEANLLQDKKLMVKERLKLINKPAIKSFRTEHGEILDCVEINKQYAFENPLLHNHTIQMKPNFKDSKQTTSTTMTSQLLPKKVRCPRGTVLIKRIQEEDLAMENFSPLLATTTTDSITHNNNSVPGHYIAIVIAGVPNIGVSGNINVWNLAVLGNQISDVSVFVASEDIEDTNGIQAGWVVHSFLKNYTEIYSYWTKDTGKTTGCYNTVCPGFVQVSPSFTLGQVINPVSTYMGDQIFTLTTLQQDQPTKNWWLTFGNEHIGYFPKELFSTLATGATRAGWGGEVLGPPTAASPAMGSGLYPEEGYEKSCLISKMQLFGPQTFPSGSDLQQSITKPECYRSHYIGSEFQRYMFVGGPGNCTS